MTTTGPLSTAPGADRELKQMKLEEEIAKASLALETAHLENLLAELALVGAGREQLESQVQWIGSRLTLDRKELDHHIERIKGSRKKIDERINTLIREQKFHPAQAPASGTSRNLDPGI